MKDILNRDIHIGDIIIFTRYNSLSIGLVVSETAGGNPRVYEYSRWDDTWGNIASAVTYGAMLLKPPATAVPEKFR